MALGCHIVRDLLPAYLEGLTGEETAREVQAHLEACAGCNKLCQELRQALSPAGAPAPGEGKKELKYLEKIRRTQDRKAVACLVLFVCLTALLFVVAFSYMDDVRNSLRLSYAVLPLCILAGCFLCYRDFSAPSGRRRGLLLGHGAVFAAAAVEILVFAQALGWVAGGPASYPLGLQAQEIGPFVASFSHLGLGVAVAAFLYGAWGILRDSFLCYFLCAHALGLLGMSIGFYRILRSLDSPAGFFSLCLQAGGMYVTGLAMAVALWQLLKRWGPAARKS